MAVVLRKSGGTSATGTSHTLNYPASPVAGDLGLLWVVVPTTKTVTTPSGWTLLYSSDNGAVTSYAFGGFTYASGTSLTLTTVSTDVGYAFCFFNSNAPSGVTLAYGQQTYTGTGTEVTDGGDTYTYSADGKGNSDTTADTTFGGFPGGKLCHTDIALFFWSGDGTATITVGGDDTAGQYNALPTSTTLVKGLITSTFRVEVGRGFTLSASAKTVGFATWLSENGDTGGGGGPGGDGTINESPPTYSYPAYDNDKPARKSSTANGGWYFPSGSYQGTRASDGDVQRRIRAAFVQGRPDVDGGAGAAGTGTYGGGSSIH